MTIFPKVLAVAATALTLGVAVPTPASAHWDRWQHNHGWEHRPHWRHHHHRHHYGYGYSYSQPYYAPSYGGYYVQPRPYYYQRW